MPALTAKMVARMACPREVVLWNYFDHEHVVGTHYRHYQSIRVIAESHDWTFTERSLRLPLLRITVRPKNFCYFITPFHFVSYQIGTLFLVEQTFRLEELGPEECSVTLENKLELPFFAAPFMPLLRPLFQRLSEKWFQATWVEDAPMRLRRWRVWKLGFRNFMGIDYINQKTARPENLGQPFRAYPVELPVQKGASIFQAGDKRPFRKSVEVGYGLPDL